MTKNEAISSVTVNYEGTGHAAKPSALGLGAMQERAYKKRVEQYLLIKSPPASGKRRALMFIVLDKLHNQGVKQAIIAVPEKAIGSLFADEDLSENGFWTDWHMEPRWNLCSTSGDDGGNVRAVKSFLESDDKVLVCTHSTLRFAVERFGIEAFDDRLVALDEFDYTRADEANVLGSRLKEFVERDKVHVVAMSGSCSRQ